MKKEQITTLCRLHQYISAIDDKMALEIDKNIKTYIAHYESANINEDVSLFIKLQLKKEGIIADDSRRINKKCRKLASIYMDNDDLWMYGENWFCVLAYVVTIGCLAARILQEYAIKISNDVLMMGMSLAALIVWIFINSNRSRKSRTKVMLNLFNRYSPSLIMVTNVIFYYMVLSKWSRVLLILMLAGSILAMIVLLKYKYQMYEKLTGM